MKYNNLYLLFIFIFIILFFSFLNNSVIQCNFKEKENDTDHFTKVLIDESSKGFLYSEKIQSYYSGTTFYPPIEEYGWPEDTDFSYSFNNNESWGFSNLTQKLMEVSEIAIKRSGKIDYTSLKNYDILIIASFTENYDLDEAGAIKKFVENGGGLLVLGNLNHPNNSVSNIFGISFEVEDVVICNPDAKKDEDDQFILKETPNGDKIYRWTPKNHYFHLKNIERHPITANIEKIALYQGIPIINYGKGNVLIKTDADTWADTGEKIYSISHQKWYLNPAEKDEDEMGGPFDILLALNDIGKGRAVFIGGSFSFINYITEKNQENVQLIFNIIKWLGEPGGPYIQYKSIISRAQQELSNAKSLFDNQEFSQAKNKFIVAINLFEESLEIYPDNNTNQDIKETGNYIQKCNIAIEANQFFDEAEILFDKKEFEEAIKEYGKAQLLYEQIEIVEKINECISKIDKSNNWINLREQAISLFQQGEETLIMAQNNHDSIFYREAKSLFERVRNIWAEYGDLAQVVVCEEKIQLCDDQIIEIERNKLKIILFVIGILILIASIFYLRRKKQFKVNEIRKVPKISKKNQKKLRKKIDEDYIEDRIPREEYLRKKKELEEI